jgi:hypothetical protein
MGFRGCAANLPSIEFGYDSIRQKGGENEKNGIGLGGNMLLYLRRARRRK